MGARLEKNSNGWQFSRNGAWDRALHLMCRQVTLPRCVTAMNNKSRDANESKQNEQYAILTKTLYIIYPYMLLVAVCLFVIVFIFMVRVPFDDVHGIRFTSFFSSSVLQIVHFVALCSHSPTHHGFAHLISFMSFTLPSFKWDFWCVCVSAPTLHFV